ncbi:MAG TPA: molybdopterin-dependent oxidoreductase, partial [Anaerolineales bacterium]|nr:molybdopterin-dependent oxidoreductase [Anaerolineales bacterium]
MTDLFKTVPIRSSEITPKSVYLSRRDFMKAATLTTGAALLTACAPSVAGAAEDNAPVPTSNATDELGDPVNSYTDITNYNNYYEFTVDKQQVADEARGFNLAPWTVEVGGLVNNPKTFGIEDLLKLFPQEERIYRLRCVEGWSAVIPWVGFPLSELLKRVEPTGSAKFVEFWSLADPEQMPFIRLP